MFKKQTITNKAKSKHGAQTTKLTTYLGSLYQKVKDVLG